MITFSIIWGSYALVPTPLYCASRMLRSNLFIISLTIRTKCPSGIISPISGGTESYVLVDSLWRFVFSFPFYIKLLRLSPYFWDSLALAKRMLVVGNGLAPFRYERVAEGVKPLPYKSFALDILRGWPKRVKSLYRAEVVPKVRNLRNKFQKWGQESAINVNYWCNPIFMAKKPVSRGVENEV